MFGFIGGVLPVGSPFGSTPDACCSTRAALGARQVRCRAVQQPAESPEAVREAEIKERVRAELASAGIEMDQLMNPEKVVKLERKIELKVAELSGAGLDAAAATKARIELEKMQGALVVEKRMVIQTWLKSIFFYQGIFTAVLGGFLSYGYLPGWEGEIPLVAKALGFWMIWLFTIPSWRARKPEKWEKSALNIAFLATPLANLSIPFISKDTFAIWGANVVLTAVCYAYYYAKDNDTGSSDSGVKIKGVLRYLDWGSWR